MIGELQSDMQAIYGGAEVCNEAGVCQDEGALKALMARSRDYNTLLTAWKGFRNVTGPPMRPNYGTFVKLSNIGAREHGTLSAQCIRWSKLPTRKKIWSAIKNLNCEEISAL